MSLTLNELMKKAEKKGIKNSAKSSVTPIKEFISPWEQESVLFNNKNQVDKPGLITTSIDLVYKPDQSTGFINQVENQVDKPQSLNLVYEPSLMTLDKLRGNPLRVIRFLFLAIDNFDEKITRKIQLAEIMQALEITRDSARTGIKFLTKNNLISTMDYQAGLNGWTRYKFQNHIFNEIWSINQVHGSGLKSGLSNSNNSNTTTIGDGWEKVDITPLEDNGLTKNSLLQLKNSNTPEIVQESINHFAFSLQFNERVKSYKDPISALIKILKRGEAWVDPNYISPQERAVNQILEAKKLEQAKLQQVEKELFEIEFLAWRNNLTEMEKNQLMPAGLRMPQDVALSLHFKEKFWPEIKKKLQI